jgi:hypothetical protein
MPTAAPALNSLRNSRLWILGPWRDLALFVLVPLWIVPLVLWAKSRFEFNVYGAVALALVAVGHHLPGFIRAYTDPVLFRRHRVRFIAAPLFFLAIFVASSLLQLHGLRVMVVLWGAWHGAMQVNGFLRIYDAKVGSFSRLTRRLDWAMCLAWFGAGLIHSDSRVTAILLYFYGAGVSAIDPGTFALFRTEWDFLTAGVTLAFLVNAWREARAGRAPSPVKFLLMASSFGFFWFAMVQVREPILGLLLFEIFHDIQYNTLVWAYNRGRVDRRLGAGRFETLLFGPGVWRIALYTVLVLAYGTLGAVTGYSTTLVPDFLKPTLGSFNFWTGLFMVSVFLHFYFDGFIWQVREKEFREGLGIDGKKEAKSRPAIPVAGSGRGLPTGWKWAFFIVPVALLGALELRGNPRPLLDQYRNIGLILPESGRFHYVLANLEKSEKNFGRAMEEYSRSLEADPDYQPAHAELADVEAFVGRYDLALPHYLRAAELDSLDYATRAHLATTLLRVNRVAEALPHLLATATRSPGDTNLIYLTGAALMHQQRSAEAVPYLRRALQLDPRQPRAWSYLGVAARRQGDTAAAEEFYRRAVALDPANAWR